MSSRMTTSACARPWRGSTNSNNSPTATNATRSALAGGRTPASEVGIAGDIWNCAESKWQFSADAFGSGQVEQFAAERDVLDGQADGFEERHALVSAATDGVAAYHVGQLDRPRPIDHALFQGGDKIAGFAAAGFDTFANDIFGQASDLRIHF